MLTLRDILQFAIFKSADAEVVGEAIHLDRLVRWVHVAELPDIAHLLKGGELLLTTGMGLKIAPEAQRCYIRELAEAGVVGLGIELGSTFTEVPSPIVEEAALQHLPVIVFKKEVRYVEVTEVVHGAIINRQYELLKKAETIGRNFTQLALNGADLRLILQSLAGIVGNPVVFENLAHQVVESAHYVSSIDETLNHWEKHSRMHHDDRGEPGIVHDAESEPPCTWIGIWVRHELWGRLHVLRLDSPNDEATRMALDRAAATVGMTLLAQQDIDQISDRARSALMMDLVQGRYASVEEVFRRARSLGADLEGKQLAAMIVDLPNFAEFAETRRLSEDERLRVRLNVLTEVRRAITGLDVSALTGMQGDRFLILIGCRPGQRSAKATWDDIAQSILKRIHASQGLDAVVGVSQLTYPESLPLAFRDAAGAARFGWRIGRRSGVHHFGELGLYQVLLPLADRPELPRFIESELGPILAHDAASSTRLLPTLRAYLSHAGNKVKASNELGIRRRTVYHRLDRIERILNRSLTDHQTRMRLTFALEGMDLLDRSTFDAEASGGPGAHGRQGHLLSNGRRNDQRVGGPR